MNVLCILSFTTHRKSNLFDLLVLLIAVAFLWGATNPFIRRGSIGVEDVKATTAIRQFLAELVFLITRWQASNFYFKLKKGGKKWLL